MKNIKILFALMILPVLSIAQQGTIQFNPSTVEVTEGESFEVEVVFNTPAPISVFDLHMLFDPEFLQVVSIENMQGDLFSFIEQPTFNNAEGKMDMAAYQIGKSIPSTDFSVVKITLLAAAPTELTEVVHPFDVFPKTLLAYAGDNVLNEAGPLKVTIESSILSDGNIQGDGDLSLNVWPNPTASLANIGFELSETQRVNLSIYDIHGKLIKTVYEGMVPANQKMQFEVDLKHLAYGNYACRLSSDDAFQTKWMVLAK